MRYLGIIIVIVVICGIADPVYAQTATPTPKPTQTAVGYYSPSSVDTWTTVGGATWYDTGNALTSTTYGTYPYFWCNDNENYDGGFCYTTFRFAYTFPAGSRITGYQAGTSLWSRWTFILGGVEQVTHEYNTDGAYDVTSEYAFDSVKFVLGKKPNSGVGGYRTNNVQYTPRVYVPYQPTTCAPFGSYKTVDLLPGSINGSLTGDRIATGTYYNTERIAWNMSRTLPAASIGNAVIRSNLVVTIAGQSRTIQIGQERTGVLWFEVSGDGIYWNEQNEFYLTIGSQQWRVWPATANQIVIPQGETNITVSMDATIRQDPNYDTHPVITNLTLVYGAVLATGETLICDGDMEEWPPTWEDYWTFVAPQGQLVTRIHANILTSLLYGAPACGDGYQHIPDTIRSTDISWAGGTMYYKFRYKSYAFMTGTLGSPNVYLVDNNNAFAVDLYGTSAYDAAQTSTGWTLITGSQTVGAGTYRLVLDRSANYGNVYYDDVAISTSAISTDCSAWINQEPEQAPEETPTPTATINTPTPNPSMTGTITPGTSTVTPTYPPTETSTATYPATQTLHPSRTATASRTSTTAPNTSTPTRTFTPYGTQGTPYYPYTSTPNATWSATPAGTLASTPDMRPNLPPTSIAVYGTPGVSGPGDPVTQAQCQRPQYAWDLSWWVEYERCMVMAFVSWGPTQSAAVMQIPTVFATYEPFRSAGVLDTTYRSMQTRVATYSWYSSGMYGLSSDVTPQPASILRAFGDNDPWADGAQLIPSTSSRSAALAEAEADSTYSVYCSTRLSSALSSNLAKGVCFALNMARSIGYLPWVQLLINLACCVGIVKSYASVIQLLANQGAQQAAKESEDNGT